MATTYALGADTRLIGVRETTYGTAPNGSGGGVYSLLPYISFSLGQTRGLVDVPLLDGSRQATAPQYQAPDVAGNIITVQDTRNLGWWLAQIMGSPTTTGVNPYTHVFESGSVALPSATLEMGHPEIVPPDYQAFLGLRFGGFSFDADRQSPGLMTVPAIGQSAAAATSPRDASPILRAANLFKTGSAELKIGDSVVAAVASVGFNYNLALDVNEGMQANGQIVGVEPTRATLTGTLSSRLGTGGATLRTQIQADSPFSLTMVRTLGAASLTYLVPEVYLEEAGVGVSGPGGVDIQYNWRAARNATEGTMLRVTLVNDVASY